MSAAITRDIVRLGWPVLVGQVAVMLYGVVDTVMAGRFGTTELAAVGIGSSIYASISISLSGVLLALSPIAAQHYGAGRHGHIGEEVRQSAWLALALMLVAIPVMRHPDPFLVITQASPEVEAKARAYLEAIAWAVPSLLLFRLFQSFSTAVSRPRVVMGLNLVGLALKVPLNFVFMYGAFGIPGYGSQGLAIATAIASTATCVLAWSLVRSGGYARYGVFERFSPPRWVKLRHLLAVGLPIGATFLVDVTAFTFMTLFIARLGPVYSAAHQVAANFAALLFMLPLALGNAAGVLVGQAIGARDLVRARDTGIRALWLCLALAGGVCVLVLLGRGVIAGTYSSEPAVQAIAAGLLGLVALYHVADALQAVAVNVLRGYKRTLLPMIAYALALWGLGLAGGVWLGLTPVNLGWLGVETPLGAHGFWAAAIVGVAVGGAFVLGYFLVVSRQAIRQARASSSRA
jgi:MATE family multidrug resistance protein